MKYRTWIALWRVAIVPVSSLAFIWMTHGSAFAGTFCLAYASALYAIDFHATTHKHH